ncbi:MAG: CoA transferase, partial [Alphaproteobacteria bacterium]|nr:CoA transferase [Alphaproteobacteria bacterium]
PHLLDVGFYSHETHPSEGEIRRTRPANTFSGGHREDLRHAPLLGEDTRGVLAEAGYSEVEIEAMMANGAVKGVG